MKRLFLLLLVVCMLLAGCPMPHTVETAYVSDITLPQDASRGLINYNYLNIPQIPQEKSRWCWAAAAQIIIKYLNPNSRITQTEIVTQVFGDDRDAGESAGTAMKNNGVTYDFQWDEISMGDIKGNIDHGKPIEVDIGYKCEGCGTHCVVIFGYYELSLPVFGPYIQYVLVWNPFPGEGYRWYHYDEFVDNDAFYWRITRDNVRPL